MLCGTELHGGRRPDVCVNVIRFRLRHSKDVGRARMRLAGKHRLEVPDDLLQPGQHRLQTR